MHDARRTTHKAQRTTHNAQSTTQSTTHNTTHENTQTRKYNTHTLITASFFSSFFSSLTRWQAMNKKKDRMKGLLVACKGCETQWIVRSLQGKLRIGLAEKGVLAAIARAITLNPPAIVEGVSLPLPVFSSLLPSPSPLYPFMSFYVINAFL
jgi:DNA ligase N terminus